MVFKSRFYYNDGANEGGGGDSGEGSQSNENNDTPQIPEEIQRQLEEANQLKAELEELRAFRAANTKEPEKSAEEIAKEQEIEKVNFRKFAVENDYAKDEDFVQFETLQQKKDAELVFENYLKDFKDENPDITDEKELREAAEEDFNKTYKLTSDNEKAKEKGLAKLAKEAAEIRTPYSSKIEKAKGEYNTKKELASTYEKKFIPFTEEVKKSIPSKVVYSKMKDGETEVSFDIEVTEDDIKEVEEKFLKNHKTFYQFKEGKPDEVKSKLSAKIESYLIAKKRDEGNKKIADYFEGRGVEKGSTTGADSSFAMQQSSMRREAKVLTLQDSNDKMAQARARFN